MKILAKLGAQRGTHSNSINLVVKFSIKHKMVVLDSETKQFLNWSRLKVQLLYVIRLKF